MGGYLYWFLSFFPHLSQEAAVFAHARYVKSVCGGADPHNEVVVLDAEVGDLAGDALADNGLALHLALLVVDLGAGCL